MTHLNIRIAAFAGAVAILCATLFNAAAQQAMDPTHNMADMVTVPAPETLPVPIKMTGIGNSHITIKATPEAQAWFDQGLSLLHDFWDYESEKAFEQGIRVDPNCAMCWWGLAQAEFMHGAADAYGKKAIAEAVRLKNHASGTDKLYIDAVQAAFDAKGDDRSPSQNTAEIEIFRRLVKKAPKDIEARIFLAEAVGDGYDDKGEPKAGQKERIALLEGILREAPNDSAANHYWIHAMEPSNHPERAINSAALLASLAPTSGHMVHMPGHIYYRVGNYADAEKWFTASTEADERYLREQKVSIDDDWNYIHNMMYAIADLMEQGKLQQANALSDHLAAARGKLSPTLYIWSARDQMARISNRLPVALRIGDWDAVLAMLGESQIKEGEKTANLRWLAAELSDYARGMKALESNDAATAQAESERFDAGLWRAKQANDDKEGDKPKDDKPKDAKQKEDAQKDKPPTLDVQPDAMSAPLVKCLSVASLELRAGVLATQGKLDEAKKMFATARTDEKKLGYHEPPLYIRPVGENEAAALLRAKDYAGAKTAYEAALAERPNSGFGLYGLAQVAELQGDAAKAKERYAEFLKAWSAADPILPELAHARSATSGSINGGQ
jgi:tetratricopeptide (TPR) repeat protein